MRVSAAGRTDALITSLRGPGVWGITNKGGRLRKVSIYNTTTTAFAVALARATAAGTIGTALTEINHDGGINALAPSLVAANTHSANATLAAGLFEQATIGAAAGAGVTWTWGEEGLVIQPGTANGLMIILPVGTALHFDFSFEWEE